MKKYYATFGIQGLDGRAFEFRKYGDYAEACSHIEKVKTEGLTVNNTQYPIQGDCVWNWYSPSSITRIVLFENKD